MKKMENERISVIVPIYNVEEYLDRCIESIVGQTYKNIEVILVDDGSPDKCPQICDKWAKKDSRIIVIHKENGGLSDARNAGMKIASGKYISFIDSDDWVQQDFLQKLYETMQENDADIVECAVKYIGESGKILKERKCRESKLVLNKIEALRQLVLEQGVYQTVWNKLYKKNVIGDILFEVGRCNEDDFWTYKIFDRVHELIVIDTPLYCYFQREASIMGQGYTFKRLDGLEARFERMKYLQKYDELAIFTQEWIRYDCLFHFQSAIKWLEMPEQKIITDYIIQNMKELCRLRFRKSSVSLKYRIWFALFRKYPFIIAKLRNKIGIGL